MIIRKAYIHHYALPFRRPYVVGKLNLLKRRGCILALHDKSGHTGFGDIAPFEGLSAETLHQARIQLERIVPHLADLEIHQVMDIEKALPDGLYPSVLFGLQSALLDLWARSHKMRIAELFQAKPIGHVRINALIADRQTAHEQAQEILAKGYNAVKIKVGRNLFAEIDMLCELEKIFADKIAVRLDANRAWDFETAVYFSKRIQSCKFEYFEEPLKNSRHLGHFYRVAGVHTALDESLKWFAADPPSGVAAFIIKPGVDGGVFDVIGLIKQARKKSIKPVISNPFLSAIGLNMALNIAAAFVLPDEAMGLGALDFLEADFLQSPISVEQGALDVAAFGSALDVKRIVEARHE